MKSYTITGNHDGTVRLCCEAQIFERNQQGRATGASHIEMRIPTGPFEIGNASSKSKALAQSIMGHYYGASETDPGAAAEAARKADAFLHAFLVHNSMTPGAKLVISSDVIDRWNSLQK